MADTTTDAASELHASYEHARRRLTDLVRTLSDDELSTPVGACPEWTVKDVVAHLTGVCHDLPNGVMPGSDGAAWTAAQVARNRGADLETILAEWERHSADLAGTIGGMGLLARIITGDVAAHEQDIRTAVGRPGDRDNAELALLLDVFAGGVGGRMKSAGLPALRLVADGEERILGEGEPAATVRASRYELVRALGGRRTTEEIRAYDWEGDPGPYVDHFSVFPFPEASLGE